MSVRAGGLLGRGMRGRNPAVDGLLFIAMLGSLLLYFPLDHTMAHTHSLATSFDTVLPVVPMFAVPYLLFWPVFWAAVLWAYWTGRGFRRLAFAGVVIYSCSAVVYVLYHTEAPRVEHITGLFAGLLRLVYAHDRPFNDFPSEHASSAVLLALYAWSARRLWRWAAVILAGIILAATVLLRQHTIVGMVGGAVLAAIVWWPLRPAASQRTVIC